ncbi:response regulator transcription factor [Phragmitibacter flavus]|uniref:Response regulator transcription factor n=1 Tax=Phragmitibacter flavus TaxID=2576071 RepID=A0A5R8KDV8_9BACT|nr:response regulator transcription factor [Phragmitibacter flavus]TLD70447.1 response regulator transcription factor [Phragmitibacter flavus]
MSETIKLLIVDDHPVFRRGLREIIEENESLEIVGEASNGAEGLELAAKLQPDIVVVDVDMPELNGLDMARQLRKILSTSQVVFLTMYKDEDVFNAAIDLGVRGYVLKENAGEDIIEALLIVAEGETFFSSTMGAIGQRREDRVQALLLSKPNLDQLTPSEKRILKLIADDHTSKEIAYLLKISAKTVENHRLNICNKLHIHGSHGLLKFAFDHKSCL